MLAALRADDPEPAVARDALLTMARGAAPRPRRRVGQAVRALRRRVPIRRVRRRGALGPGLGASPRGRSKRAPRAVPHEIASRAPRGEALGRSALPRGFVCTRGAADSRRGRARSRAAPPRGRRRRRSAPRLSSSGCGLRADSGRDALHAHASRFRSGRTIATRSSPLWSTSSSRKSGPEPALAFRLGRREVAGNAHRRRVRRGITRRRRHASGPACRPRRNGGLHGRWCARSAARGATHGPPASMNPRGGGSRERRTLGRDETPWQKLLARARTPPGRSTTARSRPAAASLIGVLASVLPIIRALPLPRGVRRRSRRAQRRISILDARFLLAIARRGEPGSHADVVSAAGAVGLSQLMPSTAERVATAPR